MVCFKYLGLSFCAHIFIKVAPAPIKVGAGERKGSAGKALVLHTRDLSSDPQSPPKSKVLGGGAETS